MSENKRKCFKCGRSFAQHNVKVFRFPKPSLRNLLRCELWAQYIFPDREYSSMVLQKKLYDEHRMLCQDHFRDEDFTDASKTKLLRTAGPSDNVAKSFSSTHEPQPGSSYKLVTDSEKAGCSILRNLNTCDDTGTIDIPSKNQTPARSCCFTTTERSTGDKYLQNSYMKMSNFIGNIFDHNTQDWQVFYGRLQQFIKVNTVPVDKKRHLLLTHLSDDTYLVAKNLVHPRHLEDVEYQDIVNELNKHFSPKRCTFADREKFFEAKRAVGESVEDWAVRIGELGAYCDFGSALDMLLMNRFVLGMNVGPERDRLYEEDATTLSFAKALEIAQQAERMAQLSSENEIDTEEPTPPPLSLKEEQQIIEYMEVGDYGVEEWVNAERASN